MMKESTYKNAKLDIFEKAVAGEITESQRDELLFMLEEKKNEESLTSDQIEDFFEQLEDMYPDLKDDIKKLAKKIEKSGGNESNDESDDSDEKKDDETEVSEAAQDLFDLIESI